MHLGRYAGFRSLYVGAVALPMTLAGLLCASRATADDPASTDSSDTADNPDKPAAKPEKPARPAENKLPDSSTKRISFETAGYTDTDHITVFTPSIAASIENVTQGASMHAAYLLDVVSAASVDIVSTATKRWTEGRHEGSLGVDYKPHNFGVSLGGSISREPDYLSYGFGAVVSYDLDEKNLNLTFGYGYSHDTAGRAGTPFAIFSRVLERGTFNGSVTRVIDRSTIASFTGDVVVETGDQSKVYRYIPMFSPQEAPLVPNGASIAYVTANRLPERPLEQLPLERRRFALTSRLAHRFDDSTLRLEERFYADTWAVVASTTDARWIFDLGKRIALWPHVRFHAQKAVDFWQKAYVSGSSLQNPALAFDLPEYRTGDRELGPLWTMVGGLGVRLFLGDKAEPRSWALTVQGDLMYTSYISDLYLTGRTAGIASIGLETEL
jgi:hypothetical protein